MVRNGIWGFLSRLWLGGGEQGSHEWLYPFHCPGCSQSRRVLHLRGANHTTEICKTSPPLTHENSLLTFLHSRLKLPQRFVGSETFAVFISKGLPTISQTTFVQL